MSISISIAITITIANSISIKKAIPINNVWFCVSDGSRNPLWSEAQQRL